jgi:hypothetical protein
VLDAERLGKLAARTDACPNPTDGNAATDTSGPTTCSPLKDIHHLAQEIKALKVDPDNQIMVAGIFGWPRTGANGYPEMANAKYKIDLVPGPRPEDADNQQGQVWDYWPVCYDLAEAHSERELERALVNNLRRFLAEMDGACAFVGNIFSGLVICDQVRPGFHCPCRVRAPGSGRPSVHRREAPADRVESHGRLVSAGHAVLGIPYLASRVAAGPGEPAAGHAFAWAHPVSAPFVEDSPWARRAAAPCPGRPMRCAFASVCPVPNHASCAPSRRAQCARASIRVLASGAPGSRFSIRVARFCRRAEAPDDRSPSRGRSSENDTSALPTDATTSPG